MEQDNKIYGRIHSVETCGAVDGPGLRYVLFVQGCPLKCLFCHNPDTWCSDGGKLVSSEEVVEDIKTYKNFIKRGGVTISGGEPLFQREFVLDIVKRCKALGIHTALDTAGSVNLRLSKPLIDEADMLLLDIKALDSDVCKELTGMTNDNALEILKYTREVKKPIWVRHVLVPRYTLLLGKLERLADFLKDYDNIEKVELLPFHKMGEYKWRELGYEYKLYNTLEPSMADYEEAVEIFRSRGLPM